MQCQPKISVQHPCSLGATSRQYPCRRSTQHPCSIDPISVKHKCCSNAVPNATSIRYQFAIHLRSMQWINAVSVQNQCSGSMQFQCERSMQNQSSIDAISAHWVNAVSTQGIHSVHCIIDAVDQRNLSMQLQCDINAISM